MPRMTRRDSSPGRATRRGRRHSLRAKKPPSRFSSGSSSASASSRCLANSSGSAAIALHRFGEFVRQRRVGEQRRDLARRRKTRAQCAEVARPPRLSASLVSARGMSATPFSDSLSASHNLVSARKNAHRIQPPVDRLGIGQRRRQPVAPAYARPHPSSCGRSRGTASRRGCPTASSSARDWRASPGR